MGQAFSFVQVESEIDMDYIKQILDETKQRTESGQSFMEQRAAVANTSESDIEEELTVAHEEITKMEKELKSLVTVADFLLESQEDLQSKLDNEQANIEDAKRDATTYRLKFEQLLVSASIY